jgi:exodeoxyribonuclease V gamma subunit
VSFWSPEEEPGDTEAFDLDGLENYQLIASQTRHWPAPQQCQGLDAVISTRLDALQRAGDLPMQGLGQLKKSELQGKLTAMAQAWAEVGQAFPMAAERVAVGHSHQGRHSTVVLRDWIDAVYQNHAGERSWVLLEPSKITTTEKKQALPRPEKLLRPWLQSLLAAAAGQALHGRVVGQDGELHIRPMPAEQAGAVLDTLLAVWLQGQQGPLPLPLKTALVLAKAAHSEEDKTTDNLAEIAYEGGGDAMSVQLADVRDMCLARVFPDFEALCAARTADGQDASALARQVYGPLLEWAVACVTAHPYAPAEAF